MASIAIKAKIKRGPLLRLFMPFIFSSLSCFVSLDRGQRLGLKLFMYLDSNWGNYRTVQKRKEKTKMFKHSAFAADLHVSSLAIIQALK